jgi:elongation factor Ts
MEITAKMIKDLREATGAGPLDCKKALESTSGDMQKAVDFLREKGLARAAKKLGAGRTMNEGLIQTYLHIALHIANLAPLYVRREDVPESEVAAERDIQRRRALEEGKKPDNVIEKIVDGRMNKFFSDICLMEQVFIKDDSKTISQLLSEVVADVGESIQISRFARFALGESAAAENGTGE